MKVEHRLALEAHEITSFYELYEAAFGPLRTLAAARHVLTLEEFTEEALDPRISKYVVVDDEGRAVGLTTFTNDLTAVPWISADYFTARHPEHAARNAIYYLGFTLVEPSSQRGRVFRLTLDPLIEVTARKQAVVAFDICAHNDTVKGLARGVERSMKRAVETTFDAVDVQTYYVMEVSGLKA